MKIKILIFVLILVSAPATSFAQSAVKVESELRGLVKQLTDAQTAYDAKALDKLFTADYIEISPAGEFDPRAKVLGFYTPETKKAAGNVSTSVEIAESSIRNYGKVAVVIVRLNFTITAEGKTLPPRSMRGTFVMRKEGSAWKFSSAQYTGIRPPQPPKTQ